MSYSAIICKLENVRPAVNSDNLNLGDCFGNTVVIGKDYPEGMVGVFFGTDGILTEEFCEKNNLFPVLDDAGKKIGGGFFTRGKARVRAQTFRGNKSHGFFIPLKCLDYTGVDQSGLKTGDQFTELNGFAICTKYVSAATRQKGDSNKKKNQQPKSVMFSKHFETSQLRFYIDSIPKGARIVTTLKCHGCVDKNTVIETRERGLLSIKEIVDNKLSVNVKAYDVEKEAEAWAKIDDYYFYPNSEDWYEIELEDGTKLEITGNNPVWLPNLYCYRKTESLKIGDTLLVK